MPIEEDLFEKLRVELRRGSLIIAVLGALREERYGYTLRQSLEDAGLPIEESALYPLLRRLEAQGLLTSEWREEGKRNKRFYRLSRDGLDMLGELLAEWNAISQSIVRLTEKGQVMDLITRYLNAIRWNLPQEVKGDDIITELGDVIASRIEDREESLDRGLTRAEISTLLRDFGHPLVVAARYGKQQWLIGPEVFPFYLFALKVVLGIQLVVGLIVAVVQALTDPWNGGTTMIPALARNISQIPWGLLAPVAIITLAFAVVERTGGMSGYLRRWKPEQLPELPARLRWGKRPPKGVWSLLFEMAAAVLFILWWTGLVAFPMVQMKGRMVVPIAAPVWLDFYWPILVLAVVKLLQDLIQLLRPRWTALRLLIGSAVALAWLGVIFGLDRAGRLIIVPPGRMDPLKQAIVQGKVDHGIHVTLLGTAAVVGILWLVELWRAAASDWVVRQR